MLVLKDEEVLVELDRIDQAISSAAAFLETLQIKRAKLTDHIEIRTRPATAISLVNETKETGVIYRGEFIACRKTVRMHTTILRNLWKDFPEKREAMAGAMASCGYSRKYVARTRERLFDGCKSPLWVWRYSEELIDGWFVDTNMSSRDLMQRVLKQATKVVDLKWGEDIQVVWKST